ncbi:MAG: hypothetical protein KVP17_001347 [Porospora cf. gigantea B]|uniref:uncharacterized protein n=1 Tax=Porospora cf. gigantea B TaxID=2853592 RepID=UPI003571F5E6|nr:MAG: hypothetical protein KVP17_001347 [Porospora cf. gigantea B]
MRSIVCLIAASVMAAKPNSRLPNKSAQWPMVASIVGEKHGKFLKKADKEADMYLVEGAFAIDGYLPIADGPVQRALEDLNLDVADDSHSTTKEKKTLLAKGIQLNVADNSMNMPSSYDKNAMREWERYTLEVDASGLITITANSEYGARHALVTLRNLLESRLGKDPFTSTTDDDAGLYLPYGVFRIEDEPRLPHRGLMIDTSRTFLPVDTLKEILQTMGRTKMNVLHWHATDDQSFPLCMGKSCSQIHGPDCTIEKKVCAGAYNSQSVYWEADIITVLKEARANGIQVVMEVDSPSHARSWGAHNIQKYVGTSDFRSGGNPDDTQFKDDLVACFGYDYQGNTYCAEPICGPLNLSRNYEKVQQLAQDIFTDYNKIVTDNSLVSHVFHIGMDEFFPGCFGEEKSGTLVKNWIKDTTAIVDGMGMRAMAWDDTFKHYPGEHSVDTIPQIWVWDAEKTPDVVKAHDYFVWSRYEYMYLDCGRANPAIAGWTSWCRPWKSWFDLYKQNPDLMALDGVDPEEVEAKAIGGEACMWAEQVTADNVGTLLWPRAAAWGGAAWEPRTEAIVEPEDNSMVIHPMYNEGVGFDYTDVMKSMHFEAETQLHNWVYKVGRTGVAFTPEQSGYCQRNTEEGDFMCRLYAQDTYKVVEVDPNDGNSATLSFGLGGLVAMLVVALI